MGACRIFRDVYHPASKFQFLDGIFEELPTFFLRIWYTWSQLWLLLLGGGMSHLRFALKYCLHLLYRLSSDKRSRFY
jgi:hypothetical protein